MPMHLQTEPFRLTATEIFQIAIHHRGRWHETKVQCGFDRAQFLADDAGRRSGLRVQVRAADGVVLYEAGAKPGCEKVCVG
jgi:hypothetical protein